MSEWKGAITICDRCGAECRRQLLATEGMDGGFTKIDKFQPAAAGWRYRHDVGDLCPACDMEYRKMIDKFMSKAEGER